MKKLFFIFLVFLWFTNADAQLLKPSKLDFEVSASLYPWDVHDEGINLMLDNLTGMSGVNSVYLIALMHQEHRPFLGPVGTGPWLYIHNPVRTEWNVEDSKIYKMVVDRIRKENSKIDFRLNDLNNRNTGLYLEDLKNYISSVHMSTHTEQLGYELSDRKSRIETTRFFIGSETPIIPGIPVRILATPAIVKSSIKISIDNGAKGIALKHYDGASYSLMRAVRDGLSEAAVKGFYPHKEFEVENPDIVIANAIRTLNEAWARL